MINKDNYILGISSTHCATAALLKNGEIIACASEERFTRIKNLPGIPEKSINYCLSFAKIDASKLSTVIIADEIMPPLLWEPEKTEKTTQFRASTPSFISKFTITARKLHYYFLRQILEYKIPVARTFNQTIYDLGRKILAPKFVKERRERISQLLKIPSDKIFFLDHHQCHAYAALYSSPFPQFKEPALVFTCDAGGDNLSATVSVFKNGKLKRVAITPVNSSLGSLYTEITIFLGMKPLEHEHKVMGLAPYAPADGTQKAYAIIKKIIRFDTKTLSFKSSISYDLFSRYLNDNLRGIRFDYIAGAIQRLTEEILLSWVQSTIKKYKIHNIVCGGGVFLNVKANQKIIELPEVKKGFFMPSAGDESNAIGAVYWGHLKIAKKIPQPLSLLYLGPNFENNEIRETLKKAGIQKKYQVKFYLNIEKKIAQLLAKGKIVARLAGRMEWGARALGNRTIMADGSKIELKDIINKMIKSRDFWMPFAPTILKEAERKYLFNPKGIKAPYMIIAFGSTTKAQEELKAAMHPYDKTLRPQILDKKDNPTYYKILKEFKKLTGKSGILNTSFNLHGEPIVCSPQDALSTFERSGLEYLVLENYLVSKK